MILRILRHAIFALTALGIAATIFSGCGQYIPYTPDNPPLETPDETPDETGKDALKI